MGTRRRADTKALRKQQSWVYRHRTALISLATAIFLVILGAVAAPYANYLADRTLPPAPEYPGSTLSARADGGLVTAARWPPNTNIDCDGSVYVAGLSGNAPPESFGRVGIEDVRITALRELNAVVWYHGKLEITLTAVDEQPLLILAIEPIVFARQALQPAWGLEVSPGCGGPSQVRLLQYVLDTGSAKDMGLTVGGPDNPRANPAPFGRTFTISRSDPADVVVDTYACDGLYEFGIKISYISGDRELTAMIGSKEDPVRIVGGHQGVERFHSSTSGVRPGPPELPPRAPSRNSPVPPAAAEICS